ncbi:transposase family protein [Streptomyces spiramenti]|uniref:Transposase family protein n=1 Tax=Streptomyces spiramenti TaxID=2720606 RepID=A0ABX1AN47_9ACTN|nr:transposase family protein [Streptomyces spiramenti]
MLTLTHQRNGRPYSQFAAEFGIRATTVYRCIGADRAPFSSSP